MLLGTNIQGWSWSTKGIIERLNKYGITEIESINNGPVIFFEVTDRTQFDAAMRHIKIYAGQRVPWRVEN